MQPDEGCEVEKKKVKKKEMGRGVRHGVESSRVGARSARVHT